MNSNEFTTTKMGNNDDVSEENGMEPRNENAQNKQQKKSARPEKPRDPPKTSGRTSTGPRTVLGKRRSSRNALAHGFFSRTFLLKNESKTEYQFLVSALTNAFQPSGALEELLIEELAMLWVRKKRLLQAERADIALATDFVEIDLMTAQRKQLYEIQESGFLRNGQLSACSNPFALSTCIALLNAIREDLLCNIFDPKKDSKTLEFIYGLSWTVDPSITFLLQFKWLMGEAEAKKLNPVQESNPDREEARQLTIESLAMEIKRLSDMEELYAVVQKRRVKYLKQAAQVPGSEASERLLRYSAFWSREFERKLSLLEHVQRKRQGLPIPPTVKVDLSS